MSKLTIEEKSWAFYDWANSAYSMAITSTLLPIYFKMITDNSGISSATSTAYWGYANSFATLLISLLAPILGTIADYKDYKKRFFIFFVTIGVSFTALLSIEGAGNYKVLLLFYILTVIGFSGANIFYDSFIVDITSKERMDKISSLGYALGYIGSTIPFIICIAIVILSQKHIIPLSIASACQISFIITALWWGMFTLPMIKNVKQVNYIEREPKPVTNSFKRMLSTLKNIKHHKSVMLFLIAYFFYIDGVDTIIKMATVYGSDLGVSSTSLLIILLATQFVACPFALLYGKLAGKFKGKFMLNVAIIMYVIICIYAYFLKTTLDFWSLAMLVGTSQCGSQALS